MIDNPAGNDIKHEITYRPPTWWDRYGDTVIDALGYAYQIEGERV